MTTPGEIASTLGKAKDHFQRTLWFAALLRRDAGLGPDDVVVVGGSAIEVYTEGGYVSGDIDLCAPADAVVPVLERWGFKQPGREWVRLDWRIVVDIVGRFPSGSTTHTRVVETPYGPVRVGAVEDLILGRLALIKFWNETEESVNARLLAELPGIDWSYLEVRAKQESVYDLLKELQTPSRPDGRARKSVKRHPRGDRKRG